MRAICAPVGLPNFLRRRARRGGKFYEHYESYQSAKSRKDAHWTKLCAMWAIGDVHELVGENYKDKNECAKVIGNLFGIIGMTHHEAVETYQELYDDSRPI